MDIPPRQVLVHSLTLVDFSPPFFTIRVKTDGGLYVRTLVKVGSSLPFSSHSSSHTHTHVAGAVLFKDIGHKLDSCAYTTALERTQHGPFTLDMALRETEWTADALHQAMAKWRAANPTPTA